MNEWMIVVLAALVVSAVWYVIMRYTKNPQLKASAAVFGSKALLYAAKLMQSGIDSVPAITVHEYALRACTDASVPKSACDAVATEVARAWIEIQKDDVLLAEMKKLSDVLFGDDTVDVVQAKLFRR